MKYYIYRLKFKTAVHFGSGRLNGSMDAIYADTLFSALCHEALAIYGENGAKMLYDAVNDNKLRISDTMPYGKGLYFPKPMAFVENNDKGDSSLKKKFKGLKYIPVADLNAFFAGNYLPVETAFGSEDIRAGVRINDGKDAEPFDVGIFDFIHGKESKTGTGLYFIAGVSDEMETKLDELMTGLSYSGIGGERSSGHGRFTFSKIDGQKLKPRLDGEFKAYMSLSISMTEGDELKSIIPNASYQLIKRGGFVASDTYSDNPLKKREMYCFKSGACFDRRFDGKIFDVSDGGAHPVYRYAKPMLFGIK